MQTSLSQLYGTLKCPLCDRLYRNANTLSSCGHTFCLSCISEYSANSWECPHPGCLMPITVGGPGGGGLGKRDYGGDGGGSRGGGAGVNGGASGEGRRAGCGGVNGTFAFIYIKTIRVSVRIVI